MDSDPDGGNLPGFAVRRIRMKARSLVGRYGYLRADRSDIEQELSLEVWRRLSKYKPAKGKLDAFLYWIIEKAVATMLERLVADKRNHKGQASLDASIRGTDGDATSFAMCIEEADAWRRLGLPSRQFPHVSDLAMDVRGFLDGLPPPLLDLCSRLLDGQSLTDISRETGIPRGTLYDRREDLRQRMKDAGLG